MLQRIQSVYLALAALLGLSDLLIPAWTFSTATEKETHTAFHIISPFNEPNAMRERLFFEVPPYTNLLWFVLTIIVPILLIINIFLYKDRPRQIMLCYVALIGIGIEIAANMLQVTQGAHWLLGNAQPTPGIGFFATVLSMLLVWMASKNIRKDEKLVKSVDRIRD